MKLHFEARLRKEWAERRGEDWSWMSRVCRWVFANCNNEIEYFFLARSSDTRFIYECMWWGLMRRSPEIDDGGAFGIKKWNAFQRSWSIDNVSVARAQMLCVQIPICCYCRRRGVDSLKRVNKNIINSNVQESKRTHLSAAQHNTYMCEESVEKVVRGFRWRVREATARC